MANYKNNREYRDPLETDINAKTADVDCKHQTGHNYQTAA